MSENKRKLSKKAIRSACSRHNWALQWCWNYERMQAAGYAYAMVPVIKELYDGTEQQCRELERHMVFYNSNPITSALIMGADVALEEDYQPKVGDSLKVALMGPMAGIGDTINGIIVLPLSNILGASLAAEGSWLSIVATTLPVILLFIVRWPLFNYGYKEGVNVINDVNGASSMEKIQVGASILGLTVVGGFVPSILSKLVIQDTFLQSTIKDATGKVVQTSTPIQQSLDKILPYMIPLLVTGLCYWLIKVKKLTPLKAILILCVLAFAAGAFSII